MNEIFAAARDAATPDFIFKALEELKSQGAANISLYYGEAAGIDDIGVEPGERNMRISWVPCGAVTLAAIIVQWQGKVFDLAVFDFGTFPEILTVDEAKALPPDKPGLYMWGDPDIVDFYKIRGSLDFRKWK